MDLDIIYNEDCFVGMSRLPDCCIDLTVTSPPYDNLRKYNGYSFDFEGIARQLYRISKPGGVVVWVVCDATVNGSETGTSFRQALYFKDVCGFKLHDTMIYHREGPPLTHNRYEQKFEFMFVFSKGKPKCFTGIRDRSVSAGVSRKGKVMRQDGDELSRRSAKGIVSETKLRGNVWKYAVGTSSAREKIAHRHPAIYPESLAHDHIVSWSAHGDVVLDPFMGSGTTAKVASELGRKFIGFEISYEYCAIAAARLPRDHKKQMSLLVA